jgi:hypothetical protein
MDQVWDQIDAWISDAGQEVITGAQTAQEMVIYLVIAAAIIMGLAYFFSPYARRRIEVVLDSKTDIIVGLFVVFVVVNILIALAPAG